MTCTGIFIAGTDTGVGKSHVSSHLLRAASRRGLRVAGLKPVAAGTTFVDGRWQNDDVEALVAASHPPLDRARACPYLLAEPASPHIAAAMAGVVIETPVVTAAYGALAAERDWIVVEGSGGWSAPISTRQTMADIAVALGLPVLLVVGLRLGCLNHAMLTAAAVRASGLRLAGWIANEIDPAMPHKGANIAWLDQALGNLGVPRWGHLPWAGDGIDPTDSRARTAEESHAATCEALDMETLLSASRAPQALAKPIGIKPK